MGPHRVAGIWLGAFCLWISVSLIIRMWVIHRRAAFLKKVVWSVVLFLPLLGWLLYGGLFQVPGYTNDNSPTYSGDLQDGGGGHF